MARWIDASPAQRLHQYTLPAARKELSEAPEMIAAFKADIARYWQQRSLHDAASYQRRAVNRRVKQAIRDLRSYQRQVDWSTSLIAKYAK